MTEKFTLTGGARIGNANATYPFADLYVDKEVLKLNASIVGNLIFQPKDIISIEPYTLIPLIGQGIKINHRIENYNPKVIFWTFKDPNFVVNEIKKTGFMANTNIQISSQDLNIIELQNRGGSPIKKSVAIFFAIVWNLLLLSDFIPFFLKGKTEGSPIGIGTGLALGLVLVASILTLFSEKFRTLILKEGRGFEDIKKFLYLLIVIGGIMFVVLAIGKLKN